MRLIRCLLVIVLSAHAFGLTALTSVAANSASLPPSSELAAPDAPIKTLTVNTPIDEWDAGTINGGKCSLREALQRAAVQQDGNRGCGNDQSVAGFTEFNIQLSASPVLTQDIELPHLGSGLTIHIDAPGKFIDGGGKNGVPRDWGIFIVPGGTLHLKNLTLRNGLAIRGSAVWLTGGTLIADNVTFRDNEATSDVTGGGAIRADAGTLTVTASIFQNNKAYAYGGALATSVGYFDDTQFIGNTAAAGGAVYITTPTTYPVTFANCEFKDNKAEPTGALVPQGGYDPRNDLYGGGAINNNGHLYLFRCLLQKNTSALTRGGGGLLNTGTAIVNESVLYQNEAKDQGSGPTNNNISKSWGGGIFNLSDLDLIRASIHGNQAKYGGGIFNTGAGDLYSYNSTISNNTALLQHGGLLNEHSLFGPPYFGEVHLYHTTIGQNNPTGGSLGGFLWAEAEKSMWLTNSIIMAQCNLPQYSLGGNAIMSACVTEEDPSLGITFTADISNVTYFGMGLLPLTNGSSPVPQFMVHPLVDASIAQGIGRNDVYGCDQPLIARKDQNGADRGNLCDAGAFEAGEAPPKLTVNPGPGLVAFPVVRFDQQQMASQRTLTLQNTGGGSLHWEIQDEGGSDAITNSSAGQGDLFKNQSVDLQFLCTPFQIGDYWREILIVTNDPAQEEWEFKFRCTGAGNMPHASLSAPPGPLNFGTMPPPGMPAHQNLAMTNNGTQPLNANYGYQNPGPPWGVTPPAQAADGPSFVDETNATLQPGQTLNLDLTCTPATYGVFVNTFVITTNDPNQPTIEFPMACDTGAPWPPEPLSGGTFYLTNAPMQGIAVSPDGSQLLAGNDDDDVLRNYSRNPTTGALTYQNIYNVTVSGMSEIYDVVYSHDGKNVYYSSNVGDGVVALSRSAAFLGVTQVITAGTSYLCRINPFVYCPVGGMDGARGLALSPDEQYLYVAGTTNDALTVLRRNPNTGTLARTQVITQSLTANANYLNGVHRLAVSPDGTHIYAVGFTLGSSNVTVFQRDTTGLLSFVTTYTDTASGGFSNLAWPGDVVVSPDGKFVYISSALDGAITIFNRSSADGQLTWANTVTGIGSAYALALSHDESARRLFVTQSSNAQVQVFQRNRSTGLLTHIDTEVNPNLTNPLALAVSPDDRHVYVSLTDAANLGLRQLNTTHVAPVLDHISPASIPGLSATFTLTVAGRRFYNHSQIYFDGNPLPTVFVDDNTLQASVASGLLGGSPAKTVFVRTGTPGGGDSNAATFNVVGLDQPLIPSIESVEPSEASATGEDLVLTIHGAHFAQNAQVTYNGEPVPTQFINSQTLLATLSAAQLQAPGSGGLAVTNGEPASAALAVVEGEAPAEAAQTNATNSVVVAFSVSPPGTPATPALTRLEPASVLSGTAGAWVTVYGHNFSDSPLNQSVGRFNGVPATTVVVDDNELKLLLTPAQLAAAGTGEVTVYTDGGGVSAPLDFRILAPGEKPVPSLVGAQVADAAIGQVYVWGSDFDAGAQVRLNGVALPTTIVTPNLASVTLPSSTQGLLTLVNPGPGGGTSNALPFVFRLVYLPVLRN